MKIAVAVILAIASASNGINLQPTVDLHSMEIGPDAVKEDIAGADVFKKAAKEDNLLDVKLSAGRCWKSHSTLDGYIPLDCSGELKFKGPILELTIKVKVNCSNFPDKGKVALINYHPVSSFETDKKSLDNMFDMMQEASATHKKGEVDLKLSNSYLTRIVNDALSE